MREERSEEAAVRISEAIDHLDRSNTIFNFVVFALSSFGPIDDLDQNWRLEAMVNLSRILQPLPETTEEIITHASREIALRQLPRLLCIELVSTIETCLEDIARARICQTEPDSSSSIVEKKLSKLMRGGPFDYLPRLKQLFQADFFQDPDWNYFAELVATRNILVHRSEPIADARYVANAGPAARAAVGDALRVDNKYFTQMHAVASLLMLNLLRTLQGQPKLT